eukprot:m.12208 g.12208  ORF g.12208 m.12208 type:complete len:303 (+) comp3966_c0_seq1:78-986(+)
MMFVTVGEGSRWCGVGVVLVLLVAMMTTGCSAWAPPFSRVLQRGDEGRDVSIYQFLAFRELKSNFSVSGTFDGNTVAATNQLQAHFNLKQTGEVDEELSSLVMAHLTEDGYQDDGASAESLGYRYKVLISVAANRSIEPMAELYAGNGTLLFRFRARLHGWGECDCSKPWPDFNNSGPGLTSFAPNGNTPTGLIELDLNTPEPDPNLYGPYNVNRAVLGLKGNAGFLIPNFRDGILIHTGEWPGWQSPESMPNSEGCIHTWPQFCKQIADTLADLGVVAHQNTGGKLPYPYKCQGLLSIQQI